MGLLDWLSPVVNGTAQTVSAFGAADDARAKAKQNAVIQQIQMLRQQKEDALKQSLGESTIKKNNAEVGNYQSETKKRDFDMNNPKPDYAPPVIGPNGEVQLIDLKDPTHPTRVPGIQGKVERQPQEAKDQLVQVTGADGKLHYVWANPQSHTTTPANIDPRQPKAGGAGGSASGAQVPVADMKQRYQEIVQQAKGLANGEWDITGRMQAREGVDYGVTRENASGHPNMLHMLTQGVMGGMNVGGDDYQHYQALMNSTRALGDDVAKVFKGRQNEEAVNREVALSQLTAADYQNPQVVKQKLDRLQHIIDIAELNNPQQAGLGGSASTTTTPSQPAIDPVLAEFGIGLVKKK